MLSLNYLLSSDPTKDAFFRYLEQEIYQAKSDLDSNYTYSLKPECNIKENLDSMLRKLKRNGFVEDNDIDLMLRPSYMIMQSLIENAIAKCFMDDKLSRVEASIITSKICTPFTILKSEKLSEIDISDPFSYERLRNLSLTNYLVWGGVLSLIYSHNAKSALSGEKIQLAHYDINLNRYSHLRDLPYIKINMDEFPAHMTGAFYRINKTYITVESREINQIDNINNQFWAIKIGHPAETRVKQVDKFLSTNETEHIFMWQ